MSPSRRSARPAPVLLLCGAVLGSVALLAVLVAGPLAGLAARALGGDAPAAAVVRPSEDVAGYRFSRVSGPDGTVVTDAQGVQVARFTDGARTVTLAGPARTFAEPGGTRATVTTSTWVRLAPQPWTAPADAEPWVRPWLAAAVTDRSPDVLAVATEYFEGVPDAADGAGLRFAGDAGFGPEIDEQTRAIGSDFHDYLGVDWRFPDGVERAARADQFRFLDCSGYLRLVFGYRLGFPLLGRSDPGPGLPRKANAMATTGPGAVVLPDEGTRPTDLGPLLPGDLVFFDTDGLPDLDHSGIYLGLDSDGRHRFLSSRNTPNGPTMGDQGGPSVLEGDGFYAQLFRTARRI